MITIKFTIKKTTLLALLTMAITFFIGVVAIYALRDQFTNIKNINDAIYFAFMTYSTVGYGTANPLTALAQYITVIMALVGVGSFCTLITVILGPFIEKKIKRVLIMFDELEHLNNHAIICGINDISLKIASKLSQHNITIIFISNDSDDIQIAKSLDYYTLHGDATKIRTLQQVYIERANYLIGALAGDANNILLSMVASQLKNNMQTKSHLKIIDLIHTQDNRENAKQAGADIIITPGNLVADALFQQLDYSDS